MKRRKALKNMTLAAGGMMMLPAWAKAWTKSSVSFPPFLSPQQDTLLVAIVDTIIPATDIPGARDLDVHLFVQKMITDCYESDVQENLKKGLDAVEAMAQQRHAAPFSTCTTMQREALLTQLEISPDTTLSPETEVAVETEVSSENEQHAFFSLVKELTIRGFMTSEYVMTNHTDYNMMPGHFYGCVSVNS